MMFLHNLIHNTITPHKCTRIVRIPRGWSLVYTCQVWGNDRQCGLLKETTPVSELHAEYPGAVVVGDSAPRKLSPGERKNVRALCDELTAQRDHALAEVGRLRQQLQELQTA